MVILYTLFESLLSISIIALILFKAKVILTLMDKKSLEIEKLQFEKRKFECEFQIKERELALKEKELKYNRSKLNSTQVAIVVAILGLIGTIITALVQGELNRKLERQKFESEMVLKVATSDSIEQNKKNLQFFINAGFISDPQNKISRVLTDSLFELKLISNTSVNSGDEYFEFDSRNWKEILEEIAIWYDKEVVFFSMLPPVELEGRVPKSTSLENVLKLIGAVSNMNISIYKNFIIAGYDAHPSKVYVYKLHFENVFHTKICNKLTGHVSSFRAIPFEQAIEIGFNKLCSVCSSQPHG